MTWRDLLVSDRAPERVVPSQGFTMTLTLLSAAAMAFLAVFVAAVAGGADRLGEAWTESLSGTATVRLITDQAESDADAIATVLNGTPGIETVRRVDEVEQVTLLQPWLSDTLPLDLVSLPVLFEVALTDEGPDADELARRLTQAAPGAVYDNHQQWQAPVARAASRLSGIATLSLVLIGLITATMIALAASASLSANRQVIDVLRLVGATDAYITRVFVKRFALRAAAGAAVGALLGVVAVLLIPNGHGASGLMEVGFEGAGWLWPFLIPVFAALIAYTATRFAANRRLREVS